MPNPVGDSIRRARVRQDVTQVELARRLGVTQPRVSDIERSETPPPIGQIRDIELALGLAPGEIYRGAGMISPDENSPGFDLVEVMNRLDDVVEAVDALARALGVRMDRREADSVVTDISRAAAHRIATTSRSRFADRVKSLKDRAGASRSG